jgi:hypothetical protein
MDEEAKIEFGLGKTSEHRMMIKTLAEEIIGLIREEDVVDQMKVIELVTAAICSRFGDLDGAIFLAEGFHKHVKQQLEHWFRESSKSRT